MQTNSFRTITDLSQFNGRVYVYLPTGELAAQFMQQAEAEGFSFGDGAKPTERLATEVMAVNPDRTINYVGATGHMAFGAGVKTVGGHPLLRMTFTGSVFSPYKGNAREK